MRTPLGVWVPARRWAALGAVLLFLIAGCPGPRAKSLSPSPSGSLAAPQRSDYDPDRALLTLDQIPPVPAVPVVEERPTVPLSPAAAEHVEQARSLEAEGRFVDAASELERALRTDPEAIEIHRALAWVYCQGGAADRAGAQALRALQLRPDDGLCHYVLGRAATANGDTDEARQQYRIALHCPDVAGNPARQAMVHYRLALNLEAAGYLTAALNQYRAFEASVADVDEQPPEDRELAKLIEVQGPGAAESIAALCERLGRYGEAADALAPVVATGQANVETRTKYARMLARAGRHEAALDEARALAEHEPEGLKLLGEVYSLAGHPERVLEDLRGLYESHPDDPAFLNAWIESLVEFDRAGEAEAILRHRVADQPENSALAWVLFDFLISQGRWTEAVDVAADVVTREPESFVIARNKMRTLAEKDQAVRQLLASAGARTADSDPVGRGYLLGCLASAAGRRDLAETLLTECRNRAPDFVGTRVELGRLYLQQYRWNDALAVAELPNQDETGHPEIERLIAEACVGLDDDEQAVTHFEAAIRLNESDTQSMFELAKVRQRTGLIQQALRQYEAILQEDPLTVPAREALVMLYLDMGERGAAIEQVRELRRIAAPAEAVARCTARIEYNPDHPDFVRFRKTLLSAADSSQPDADTLYWIAQSFFAQRDYASARPFLQRGLTIEPDHEALLEMMVWLHRESLEFDQAESLLRELLRRHPNRLKWRGYLIAVLIDQQDYETAVALLRSYLSDPKLRADQRVDYRETLIETLRTARRLDEAATELESWIRDDPRNNGYRRSLIDTYLAAERYDDAWRAAQEWYDRTDGEEWEKLVEVLLVSGQYDRASQLLLDWLQDDPDKDEWQLALIDTQIAAGRIDDALEIVDTNLPHGRSRLQYEGAAIRAYEIAGRRDEAMRLIRQWIQRVERSLIDTPPFLLVELRTQFLIPQLLLADRFDDARDRLQRWFEEADDPRDRVSYLKTLSECERRSGNSAAALETLELAYELNPLDEDTCNSLGYIWTDAGRNLDRAEQLIRYAVARNPRSSAYLDSLGWVLYKKREFAGAKRWLLLALGADLGDDPVIHDHVGDALWRCGDVSQALNHWRSAVEAARLGMGPDMGPTWQEVLEQTPRKIEAAEQDRTPVVAPVGPLSGDDGAPEPAEPMEPAPIARSYWADVHAA